MELEERLAKIEGALEQMNLRLVDLRQDFNQRLVELRDVMNHRIGDLRWEVRIWFGLLVALMTLFRFLS